MTRTTESRRAAYRAPWRSNANTAAARAFVRDRFGTLIDWRRVDPDPIAPALHAETLGLLELRTTRSGDLWARLTAKGFTFATSGGVGT